MRRAARTDSNHGEIRESFRKMGFAVVDTSRMGAGFPDLIISRSLITAAIEIKRDRKAKLTPDQMTFHRDWKGHVFVVTDHDDAVNVNMLMRGEADMRVRGFR